MPGLVDQLPSNFDVEAETRNERVRRRLAAVLRQLNRRIRDLAAVENELAAQRAMVAALDAELAALRREHYAILNTKTLRLLDKPRRLYGRALSVRPHLGLDDRPSPERSR